MRLSLSLLPDLLAVTLMALSVTLLGCLAPGEQVAPNPTPVSASPAAPVIARPTPTMSPRRTVTATVPPTSTGA